MGQIAVGQLILKERKRQGLSAETLMKGIGTKQALYEIESGRQTEKQQVDILLQRLGRSPDRLEYILNWREYRFECVRDWFEECVFRKNKRWAERAMWLYEQKAARLGNVGQMYICRGRAMMAYWIDGDLPEAERWLCGALDATFPGWRGAEWGGCRLSTTELENVMALVRVRQERQYAGTGNEEEAAAAAGTGNEEEAAAAGIRCEEEVAAAADAARTEKKGSAAAAGTEGEECAAESDDAMLRRCENYIRRHVKDSEESAKSYSKCMWLMARAACMQGRPEKALLLCTEGLDRLRRCSIGYFMIPLLRMIVECQEKLKPFSAQKNAAWAWKEEDFELYDYSFEAETANYIVCETLKNDHYRYYLEGLEHLQEQLGEKWYPQDSILYNCCQKAWHLDFEILRAERCVQGMSQAQAAEGIYGAPGEIIKIEQHKRTPRQKHFSELMWKLGVEKERAEGFVVTDSFETLDLRRQIQGFTSRQQFDMARPLLWRLKRQLDMNVEENCRAIRFLQNMIDMNEETCSSAMVVEEDWKMLGKTYRLSPERLNTPPVLKQKKNRKLFYRAPMKNEAELVNQIAIALKKQGRKDEAVSLYRWVLTTFERSRIKPKYRYCSYGFLMKNLAAYECSEEKSRDALRYELACGKIGAMGYNYVTLACALEDDSANRELCRRMLRESYYLFELSQQYVNQRAIRDYYSDKYGDNIEQN